MLQLLLEKRFPRIWRPSPEDREIRRLLWHRVKMVRMRTMLSNQLQALALGQGVRCGKKLWTHRGQHQLANLPLGRFSSEQRRDLLGLTQRLDQRIATLNREVDRQAAQRPDAVRLQQQDGVGPLTALAFVLTLGPAARFRRSKQVVSYLGLNPREYSSGGRQRLGAISKQGNTLTRWLLVEAAQTAARRDPELYRVYLRLKQRRGARIAKVAIARKLAVRLYWKLRTPEPEANAQWVGPQSSPCTSMVKETSSHS